MIHQVINKKSSDYLVSFFFFIDKPIITKITPTNHIIAAAGCVFTKKDSANIITPITTNAIFSGFIFSSPHSFVNHYLGINIFGGYN